MIDSANNILDIFKTLLAIIPFLLLCLVTKKVNLKKEFRDRQFLMPVFSLIFAVVVMLFLKNINDVLLNLIKNIPIWLNNFLSMPWIPANILDFLKQPVNFISDLINNLNLKYWIFYISNIIIVSAYMIYKKICISIMQKINAKNRDLHNKVASVFYEYFPDKDIWCIKEEFVQARTFSKVVYYVVVLIASLIMLISGRLYVSGVLADIFYPVFSVILVGEIYFFLDGASRREFLKDILGEDEDAYKTVNYSLLRKYLRNIFGDKLLSENTNVNLALSNEITNDEVLEKLRADADPKVNSFATYFSNQNKSGFELDHNFLNSSLDLLNGKSILFNNPFYKDLIPYAFYPMNRALLSRKKVLVVLGRHSVENEIIQWIEDGIESVTNIPFMWRAGVLSNSNEELDIGILTRSDIINIGVQKHNKEFLENVGFVVILEPSKLITTAQIGLNLLIKKCRKDENKNIVFCLCDKNCDGLVDAMSHILMTSLTEVSATNKHQGTCSYMCWESDSDYIHHRQLPNISRYLGMGTELSFAALKNQVSKAVWYGGDAFPVADMNWIARQYYYDLMKYAALPTNQEAMNDYFQTSSNFWSAEISKNNYFTVEDESYNMYEILRNFSTRSTEQGFVNVISSAYLLKDYMADNNTIFETDAKAIPCLVADFARTNRNVILRILLLMSEEGIDEDSVKKELSLAGLPVLNIRKQLWYEIFRSLSSVDVVAELPENYEEAINAAFGQKLALHNENEEYNDSVILSEERYNFELTQMQTVYFITDKCFIRHFISNLKSASYVSEDEKGEKYYLGSELRDHIYQKVLPGQFFTYSGKYYEMQYVTHDGQVLVRRASEHIDGRPTYRQLRNYVISSLKTSDSIGAVQNIDGIEITHMYADFSVTTDGYYKMDKYNDFSTAKKVVFGGEKSKIPDRKYCNKEILRINLPQIEDTLTDNVRYTIALLMNEIFKSLFAENYPYIVALTDDSYISYDSKVKPLSYSLTVCPENTSDNSIYIIEDSNLDMGLLISVERNLVRIFRIIEDYLSWNKRKIALSLKPPQEEKPVKIDPSQVDFDETKGQKDGIIKRFLKKIGNFFKKLFGRNSGKKENDEDYAITEDKENPVDKTQTSDIPENNDFSEKTDEPTEKGTPTGEEHIPEEISENDGESDIGHIGPDDLSQNADMPSEDTTEKSEENGNNKKSQLDFSRIPYQKRYYLLYGGEGEPDVIDSNGTLSYLKKLGLGNNPLTEARRGKRISKYVEATFRPNKKNARYCDFCGSEIYGIEYETLADGRDRCISCSRTAIKTEVEFIKIFEDVKRNLESFFGIKINAGIKVRMVNAGKLNKSLGKSFIPTSKFDGRVLGVAINKHDTFTLMVENGSPRMMSMLTMAHELTHIWQYLNWNQKAIKKKYGKKLNLQIYEGMAKWVEIQYAYLINEPSTAKREEIITVNRNDEYGFGYIRYKANYPISTGTVITRDTPFMNIETPLDPMYCGSDVSILLAEDNSRRYDDELDDDDYDDFFDDDETDDEDSVTSIDESIKTRNRETLPLYAYEQLNESEKDLYNKLYNAIVSFETSVIDLPEWLTEKDLEKIRNFITIDHPQLFWFYGNYVYYTDNSTGKITKVELKYCMSKEEAENRKDQIEKALIPFEEGISDNLSDYELARLIYKNIIELVDYDSVTLDKKKNSSDVNAPDDLRSIYGVFVNRKAVCAGYAKATQYLMNKYGIECTLVTGSTNSDARHAWNLIKLEGDYYYIDTTWDDHSNTDPDKHSFTNVTYNYFCVTTEDLLKDHTPDAELKLPECTANKCNYYYRTSRVFSVYSFEKVRALVRRDVLNGHYTISVKCLQESEYGKLIKDLIDDRRFFDIIQYINLNVKVRVSSEYSYVKDKDKLIVTFILKKL